MSVRRLLTSMSLVLVVAACGENLSSPAAIVQTPRFLNWAATTRPEFAFEGAHAVGSRFASLVTPTPPAVSQSSNAAGDVQTLTWSHNGGTGPNRLLIVSVSLLSPSKPVASVTYQGAPLTFLGARNNTNGSIRVELWYRVAPPTGTGNVVVTRTDKEKTIAGAVTLTGVNQTAPLGAFASAASGSTTASLPQASAVGDLVLDAVVTRGGIVNSAGTGQTQRWNASYQNDFDGAGSTELGAASVTMSSTLSTSADWAIGAVSVKPAPTLGLTQNQATFWAVRGQSRAIQINYSADGGTSPFLRLTTTDPTYVPGQGNLAVGDSILVTVTVDPSAMAVTLQPHGMLFGDPAQLAIWYGGANGDLNGDGVVDATDAYIETNLLGIWYQALPTDPWSPISAMQSVTEKSFTAALQHFSGYSVAW